ncbi:MAG: WD40 repeat domain-containing protein [Mycobacterium sp.]
MTLTARIVETFSHAGPVKAMAFSTDGDRLATVSDTTVEIRKVADGTPISTFTSNLTSISDVVLGTTRAAAYGAVTAGGATAYAVVAYDPGTGTQLWRVDRSTIMSSLFDPSGRLLLITGPGNVQAMDSASGALRWSLDLSPNQGVNKCIFSSDGQLFLLLGGSEAAVCDGSTGSLLWRYGPLPVGQGIFAAAISPDRARIALSIGVGPNGSIPEIVMLDVATDTVTDRFAQPGPARLLTFSPDGRFLGFSTDYEVGTIELSAVAIHASPNPVDPQYGNSRRVASLSFSADSEMVGVVTTRGARPPRPGVLYRPGIVAIRVFDAATMHMRRELDHASSRVFAFSPDSRAVLTAENGQDAHVWNVATGADRYALSRQGGAPIGGAMIGPDGHYAAVRAAETVTLFELPALELVRLDHDGPLRAVAFSATNGQVLTGSTDATARVWDVTSGTEIHRLTHDAAVTATLWIPGGPLIATGSSDGSARIFDPTAATEHGRVRLDGAVIALTVSPDGQRVAVAGDDDTVRLISVATGQQIRRLNHGDAVNAVAFDGAGGRLATGSADNSARVFNTTTGAQELSLAHNGSVSSVAFSPDASHLATGSADGTVRIFSMQTGNLTGQLNFGAPVNTVVFSADGACLGVGVDDGTARIAMAATASETRRLPHDGAVCAVEFTPNGAALCTASIDGSVRVFDASTGQLLSRLVHDGPVRALDVDPSGTMLISGSDDGSARVYALPAGLQ